MSNPTSSEKKEWKRPTDVAPFPQIWRRSTLKNKDTGETFKIRIQDITSDRYDEVWDMYRGHFYPDEYVHSLLNTSADKVSLESEKQFNDYKLLENLSIIAVLDNEDSKPTILGGLLLTVISKYDPPEEPRSPSAAGKASAALDRVIMWIREGVNLFEGLESDHILKELGLVVKREYRGMGVGCELFRTVECIAKAFHIPAISVLFSVPSSQKIGAKLGMTLQRERKMVDCVDESGRKILPAADPEKTLQCGYIKYDI